MNMKSIFIMKVPICLVGLAAALLAAGGCAGAPNLNSDLNDAAEAVLSAKTSNAPSPSYTFFALMKDGETVSASVGEANLELGVPASAETVYHIGSITKQFTAAAILMLAEDGALRLDDPAAVYIPEYAAELSGATIRQLLNHTSGVRNYTSIAPPSAPLWTQTFRHDLSEEDMMALFMKEPRDFSPGEGFVYSNSGYYLAGVIVSRASGMPYDRFLEKRIFKPLTMRSAGLCAKTQIVPHRANGYVTSPEGIANNGMLSVSIPYSAGALCMNVKDLARWVRALHQGEVISADSLRQMQTATLVKGRYAVPYGLGLFLDDLNGQKRVGHAGLFNGFTAVAWLYPELDLVTALLSNQVSGEREDDVVYLETEIMQRWLALGEAASSPPPNDLPPYVGVYGAGRTDHAMTLEDGALRLDGTTLLPVRPDLYMVETGPPYRVKFLRDASGKIAAYYYMRGSVSYLAEKK